MGVGRRMKRRNLILTILCSFSGQMFLCLKRIHNSFSMLSPRVTHDMNERSIKEFTLDEVKGVLDLIHWRPESTWTRRLVSHFLQEFLGCGWWEAVYGGFGIVEWGQDAGRVEWHCHIALIPKISKRDKVTNLLPVSLCNVVYKVV
jgi:hypothetical protein